MVNIFGVNSIDGTITLCKAKPENRGKGKCPHSEHVERSEQDSSLAAVAAFNEEKLKEYYDGNLLSFKAKPEEGFNEPIQAHSANAALSPADFQAATENISQVFTQEDWTLLQDFYEDLEGLLEQETELHHNTRQIIMRMKMYLESEDPVAEKVRAFLGPEVDLENFSAIMVSEVKAMTATSKLKNHSRRDSSTRIVATSVANDMNRKRYVASVLFFGGRCCYCNCVLTKEPGLPTQATGEHITPVTPDDPQAPRGVTRYGNMALACFACNQARKSKDLSEWVEDTDRIPNEEKEQTLKRIEAFRRFALYEEYSPAKSQAIIEASLKIKALETDLPRIVKAPGQKFPIFEKSPFQAYVAATKVILFDLGQVLKE